jgi:hypothetical protein
LDQSPDREDLHQDGFFVTEDQPSEISFDHCREGDGWPALQRDSKFLQRYLSSRISSPLPRLITRTHARPPPTHPLAGVAESRPGLTAT